MSVLFLPRAAALAVSSTLFFAAASPAGAQPISVDHERLTVRLAERGLTSTDDLRALVVRFREADDGTLVREDYDHAGTSSDREGWWPSATVNLYAATAALVRLDELGFPPDSWVTFEYDEGPVTLRLDNVIRHALVDRSDEAFDRLVEFIGFDRLNTGFFTTGNGFTDTVMLRASGERNVDPETGNSLNRRSPAMVVRRGQRARRIPAREGQGTYSCPDQGNCTSPGELAEAMARVMLHEVLPETERYDLRPADLELLRSSLAIARSQEISDIMTAAFGDAPVEVYHRPGFGMQWASDIMYVHRTDTNERWVIAVSARPGRQALDAAVGAIGAILAADEL